MLSTNGTAASASLTIVADPALAHQVLYAKAFAAGLAAHGITAPIVAPDFPIATQRVVTWGWRIGKPLREAGHDVLVMERGYIERMKHISLGWNGLNGRAVFPTPQPGRFARMFGELPEWRPRGHYVLVVGQVDGDMAAPPASWYAHAVASARVFGLPVMFRPHPEQPETEIDGLQTVRGSLENAIGPAALVVTYSSNVGVDALLFGKPVAALDHGSMVYAVAANTFSIEPEPDRAAWAEWIAGCQWTPQEIESGAAWERLKNLPDVST